MLAFIQRHIRALYLLLIVLLGLSLGYMAAMIAGLRIAPPPGPAEQAADRRSDRPGRPELADFEVILQRNIFDTSTPAPQSLQQTEQKTAPEPRTRSQSAADLALLGTVVAGPDSLALIRADRETDLYRLGEEVPGGATIREITRKTVVVAHADGTTETLALYEDGRPRASASQAAGGNARSSIRQVGENRFVIPREQVERARQNINQLLKQARMEPRIVNGRTDGFAVEMVRPNSLLAMLGIKVGDVVMQVNGMDLNSPEKALQIFQQLREADNISIGLLRNGDRKHFEYEVN